MSLPADHDAYRAVQALPEIGPVLAAVDRIDDITRFGHPARLSLEFEPAPYAHSSVLTYCDMTTSPDGKLIPVERRLAEIHRRYGSGHVVNRSIQRATSMILRAVEQVQCRAA